MYLLILWIVFWLLVWGVFGKFFSWNIAKTKFEKYYRTSFFFSLNSIVVYFIFKNFLSGPIDFILSGFLITLTLGIFFSDYYPYYKHIKNGKYYLVSLAFNILFQQLGVVAGVKILSQYFGQDYKDVYFGIMFFIAHSPIILAKWVKLRYFYLILTFLGGTAFSFLIRNYSDIGLVASFLLHYSLYIPIFYYLRDERKI